MTGNRFDDYRPDLPALFEAQERVLAGAPRGGTSATGLDPLWGLRARARLYATGLIIRTGLHARLIHANLRLDWFEELDPVKDIQMQLKVDLLGVAWTARAVLPQMYRQGSGHIINMCSMAGLVATPTYTIYAACKHAVHGFSEALRREVKPWGIDVSMIYPGGVTTEFGAHAGIKRKTNATTPRFMLLTAEQVGREVVNLVHRPRAMRIIPWLWTFTVWMNRNFNSFVDYTTINRFTIPEREEELKAR